MGVRGCCASSSCVDLGDALVPLITDPLQLNAVAESAADDRPPGIVRPFFERVLGLDKALDAGIEGDAVSVLRSGCSVPQLMSRNINAETLLQDDPGKGDVFSALVEGGYRTKALKMLGFTWKHLVAAGLTRKTWVEARELFPVMELVEHLQLTADQVLVDLCGGVTSELPQLHLEPDDWVVLVAHPETPADFLARVKATPLSFVDYSMREWREMMQLTGRQIQTVFQWSPEEIHSFIVRGTSIEDRDDIAGAYAEFTHLFGIKCHVPAPRNTGELPQGNRGRARGVPPAARHRPNAVARGARRGPLPHRPGRRHGSRAPLAQPMNFKVLD